VTTHEIHLESLLSKRVLDINGQSIGRIEEVHAVQHGEDYYVHEYLLGPYALLERLSLWVMTLPLLRLFRARNCGAEYRLPWDRLDLTDPERPQLRCTREEL
jgi:sporulation protein YlmC with PRC-barrel domain